ncbi:MAG: endonuclease/exonuclease/phosphatase family protein [Elainellaceae cyanobacterium]
MNPQPPRQTRPHWILASRVLVVSVVALTLLSLSRYYGLIFPIELLSHFQLQYFATTLILGGLLSAIARRWLIYVAVACLGIQLIPILPWYVPLSDATPLTHGYALRVLSVNVNAQNHHYQETIQLVQAEQPDIAIFIEADDAWIQQLQSLDDLFPYAAQQPDSYNRGVAVYSRTPLSNTSAEPWGTDQESSVVTTVAIANQSVRLIAVHPPPPIRSSLLHIRNRQLNEIQQYLMESDPPFIVAGDFNITMWSPFYQRLIQTMPLKNTRRGIGLLPTWPVDAAFPQTGTLIYPFVQIPIDHCLVSPTIQVKAMRTGHPVGSDHLPIIVDLWVPLS